MFKNDFIKPLDYQSAVKSKPKSKESIAERTKLRKQRIDENAKKEKTINLYLFNYYFKYLSPSDMYKKLREADTENNKVKTDFIKDDVVNLKKDIENVSKDDVDKIKEMNKIADIVELIIYFNEDQ